MCFNFDETPFCRRSKWNRIFVWVHGIIESLVRVHSHQFHLFTWSQIQIDARSEIHLTPPFHLSPTTFFVHFERSLCIFSLVKFSATLLLVPLLGMQYILTPFRPEEGADGAFAYELISAIITSFQVGANNLLFMVCVWASTDFASLNGKPTLKWPNWKFCMAMGDGHSRINHIHANLRTHTHIKPFTRASKVQTRSNDSCV